MKMLWVGLGTTPSRRAKIEMAEAKAAGHEVEYRHADSVLHGETATMIYFDELTEMQPEQQKASAEPTARELG